MLSFRAISEAAICSLPDRLTGRVSAQAEILGNLDIVTVSALRGLLFEPNEAPVFAAEITLAPL